MQTQIYFLIYRSFAFEMHEEPFAICEYMKCLIEFIALACKMRWLSNSIVIVICSIRTMPAMHWPWILLRLEKRSWHQLGQQFGHVACSLFLLFRNAAGIARPALALRMQAVAHKVKLCEWPTYTCPAVHCPLSTRLSSCLVSCR